MTEEEVEFLAGDSRQFESLPDLVSQITVGDGKPQVDFLDLRRVIVDDKFCLVGFDVSVHVRHSRHGCFFPAFHHWPCYFETVRLA